MAPQRETRVAGVLGALVLPVVVAALVAALGIAAWGRGDLNRFICDGDCGPANVIAPKALTTGSTPGSTALPRSSSGPVDGAKVTAAVAPALASQVLGPRVGFTAVSPEGTVLAASGAGAYVPASTTKVLVGFAALRSLDPQSTFATRVVRSEDGIVLVGGGDPYLTTRPDKGDRVTRADLRTLARRTASVLKRSGDTRVTMDYDASLFTGPAASPGWEPSYVADDITTRVSALWADQGVVGGVRSREPAASAARTFVGLLEDRGIEVEGEPRRTTAEDDARTVAEVRSATVAQIVEKLIRISDNQAAEVMLRHVAIAADQDASFEGGTSAVRSVLEDAGVDTADLSLSDGSGLSRRNRVSPTTLVDTLRAAAGASRTAGLMVDLPVSGFTGTLVSRFDQLSGALGSVRAKTGTLTGVHSLAGYATDAEGRPVLFAVMADRSDKAQSFAAQAALDAVAAAIATCRCG